MGQKKSIFWNYFEKNLDKTIPLWYHLKKFCETFHKFWKRIIKRGVYYGQETDNGQRVARGKG